METPTKRRYCFSKGDMPVEDEKGRSGNFDLVILDSSLKRLALIEFKANNPEAKDYAKDFVKLENNNEPGELRYFVQLLKNVNKQTIASIKSKIGHSNKIFYRCWSLDGKNRTDDIA